MILGAHSQKLMYEGMKVDVVYPATIYFDSLDQLYALQNQVGIMVKAKNEDGIDSVLFEIKPNGNIKLATGISKKLGLDLDTNGSLKVLPAETDSDLVPETVEGCTLASLA